MQAVSTAKLAYTIDEGRRALGVGRTSFYGLIKAGEVESFKACGRTLVTAESLRGFIARAQAASSSIIATEVPTRRFVR